MRPNRFFLVLISTAALWLLAGAAYGANENYTFALSLTLGGTSDADLGDLPSTGSAADPGNDNIGFQASFSLHTEHSVLFVVRAGQLPLDIDEASSGIYDADLSYLVLAGEYRFPASFYESGLFIGLGAYDLSGGAFIRDETGFGLVIGVTGDFPITDRFSILGEIAGHATDLDYAGVFLTAGVGVAYHF